MVTDTTIEDKVGTAMDTDDEATRMETEGQPYKKARRAAEGVSATLIEKLAERIGANAGVHAVFGDPIVRDGRTVIPVAQSVWGTGAGSGESEDEGTGSGGGGGVMSKPVGFIEMTELEATFHPLARPWQDGRLILAWAFAIWIVSRAVNRILRG